jgi:hypothetical protein
MLLVDRPSGHSRYVAVGVTRIVMLLSGVLTPGGLIVTASDSAVTYRDLIISLALRYRVCTENLNPHIMVMKSAKDRV